MNQKLVQQDGTYRCHQTGPRQPQQLTIASTQKINHDMIKPNHHEYTNQQQILQDIVVEHIAHRRIGLVNPYIAKYPTFTE